jgi:predicted transcriptional regulator YdeE
LIFEFLMEDNMQPQPQLQHLKPFAVSGLTARTSNRDERDPQVSRIGTLWGRFFDERVYEHTPNRIADMRLYGVYSAYEADAHGAFDLTAGVAVSRGPAAVQIEGGDYLVFNGQGQMPQMVLEVWQAIWQYFEQHPHIRRRYCTDFEAYSGPEEVAIHIGVLLE